MSDRAGLALLCDMDGNITRILREMPGVTESIRPGMPFTRLSAPGSLSKALSFIQEIHTQGVAFGWEIYVTSAGQMDILHFAGGKVGDTMLIVGDGDSDQALFLYEEIARISSEQANDLRAAVKGQNYPAYSDKFYDEISRLNNELVSAQRELAKKNAELELLNKEKNRLLGMAAHDLRNPLYVIHSASELLLLMDANDDPALHNELLQTIQTASDFMSQLIENLLDVAVIEAGELNLELLPIDLAALLTRNAAFNRLLAARKQIELDYKLQAVPSVLVDSAKMEQVLNNLIGNAVKFSEPGSKIEIGLEQGEKDVLLCVKDSGVGIPPEQVSSLFRPFQRGQRGTQGEKSTGLGLAIVKRIVEGHGGRIWVESEVGHGTTFYVSIPFHLEDV